MMSQNEPADYALRVAVVYDGDASQHRTSRLFDDVAQTIGHESLQVSSWQVEELDRPEILADAAQAAVEADLILVSLSDGETLPALLCVWIDVWLPRRGKCGGALVAIFGALGESPAGSSETQTYLRAVARQGDMEFFLKNGSGS